MLFRYQFIIMQKKSAQQICREAQSPSDLLSASQCINFISLSHYQMHKLVHDTQTFVVKVKNINNQASRKIQNGQNRQALILLIQAQKILQYGAGSGKSIDRDLIICVLHNIAAAYQRLLELDKCISYVQGLIFNLQNNLQSLQNSVVSSNQQQQRLVAIQGLQMKQMLATYSIRFCALNSQKYNHPGALSSAKKAIGYIRNILTFDQYYIRSLFRNQEQKQSKVQLKYKLLMELLQFQHGLNVKRHKQLLKATHYSIQFWNKNTHKNQSQFYAFRNYSIGDFMELIAKEYLDKKDKLSQKYQQQLIFENSIAYKLIILSIAFFSIATQMRLNIGQNQYYSQLQKQTGFPYIQAEMYHLMSIIAIAAFIPWDILYLKHVINSYSSYFNSGLVDYKTVQTESIQKIIELISDNKFKSPQPGSTQIISSQEIINDQNNEYKLKDKIIVKSKNNQKRVNYKFNKKVSQKSQIKRQKSNIFSHLQNKSVLKQDKRLKTMKIQSKQKQKSKSKPKSKSKTFEKKSKEKDSYLGIKNNSKSRKKINYEELYTISKKVSPKKSKEHKQLVSQIVPKSSRRSILKHKTSLSKRLAENKSPKKRSNVYGLNY